jgi:hypothetical protein
MNWKGCGSKRSWSNVKVLHQNLPGRTEKTTENLNHDSLSPGRNLNPGSPEYEAGVLTTRPQSSVLPFNARSNK